MGQDVLQELGHHVRVLQNERLHTPVVLAAFPLERDDALEGEHGNCARVSYSLRRPSTRVPPRKGWICLTQFSAVATLLTTSRMSAVDFFATSLVAIALSAWNALSMTAELSAK